MERISVIALLLFAVSLTCLTQETPAPDDSSASRPKTGICHFCLFTRASKKKAHPVKAPALLASDVAAQSDKIRPVLAERMAAAGYNIEWDKANELAYRRTDPEGVMRVRFFFAPQDWGTLLSASAEEVRRRAFGGADEVSTVQDDQLRSDLQLLLDDVAAAFRKH